MKTISRQGPRPFLLKLLYFECSYYIERVARLEALLARKPRVLQIDLIGSGEIPADAALLIRSILMGRSPKTRLVTHARSSLHGGSVLVWLLGDSRIIRDDAKLFFRRADLPEEHEEKKDKVWTDEEPNPWDSSSEIEPGEGDYARVLQLINEFLPVKELVGRLIEVPVLRQFGLVENEKVDHFLATAFGKTREPADGPLSGPEEKRIRRPARTSRSRQIKR